MLRSPDLAGTAVLINEFGEVGIDHLLVERLDEETVLLASGCLCCAVRGDLVRALTNLATRDGLKRVVIETSGLADPVPVLQTLISERSVARAYALDGMIAVIDAVNGATNLDREPQAARQAALADILVLAKTDLAAPENVTPLAARLTRLNPMARQIIAVRGAVAPAWMLGNAEARDAARDWGRLAGLEAHQSHDAGVSSFCLTWEKPLHWQGFGMCLEMLIAARGASLLRVKGILDLEGQPRPVAIHGVQHIFHEPQLLQAWPADEPRRSRLVFITRDLDRAIVAEAFAAFEQASGAPASGEPR
jgi:G3E family GTPase